MVEKVKVGVGSVKEVYPNMMLSVEQRRLIGEAVDRTGNKSLVAKVLGVSRDTVYRWSKRRKQLKDRKRKPKKSKVTVKVELSILAMRSLDWGCERIRKGLFCLPKFMREAVGVLVQGVKLSRQAINDVLKKHGLNGYRKKSEGWKFFRAAKPDELWQLDVKGPYTVRSRKYWFLICIDDYSRYVVLAEQLTYAPSQEQAWELLQPAIAKHKPENILTDNSPFREEWDNLCKSKSIKSLHAHPYYPQDKGKVERTIRNFSEEFIYLLTKFPEWLKGKLQPFTQWFNNKRYHCGIKAIPAQLYA